MCRLCRKLHGIYDLWVRRHPTVLLEIIHYVIIYLPQFLFYFERESVAWDRALAALAAATSRIDLCSYFLSLEEIIRRIERRMIVV